jgi:diadenosine tetraphosphate (Ap4A) HIT family hydrolase
MNRTCKFCSVFDLAEAPCDRPILRTPNFIVAPSIGALVPGWMLIVSTDHYVSAGALPHDSLLELRETIDTVATAMRHVSRSAAIFEHGPVCENTVVGCGIDHCHVHVVPLEFDLYSEAAQLSRERGIRWDVAADLTATRDYHEAGHSYLYIEQNGLRRIGTSPNHLSQFFRRVIASRQGRPEEFDWKRHDAVSPAHLAEAHRLSLVLPGAQLSG